MIRETGRRYDPEEEIEKKKSRKPEAKTEMVEFLIETTSITTTVSGLGADKLIGNAGELIDGVGKLNSLDIEKFESIRRTAEYAEVYEKGFAKADEFSKKDKEETNRRIREIRDWLKGRKSNKKEIPKSAKAKV